MKHVSDRVNLVAPVSPVHGARYSTNWDRIDPARKFKWTTAARGKFFITVHELYSKFQVTQFCE